MILYQLRCSNGHEFEGWFQNSGTYDHQISQQAVNCPICSDTAISKAIMSPNISPARSSSKNQNEKGVSLHEKGEVADRVNKVAEILRTYVEDTCENVGEKFPEEARKIFYGESEARGIYGKATEKEVADLDDEGIEFYKIPERIRRDS